MDDSLESPVPLETELSASHIKHGPKHEKKKPRSKFSDKLSRVQRPAIMNRHEHPVARTLTDIFIVLVFLAASCVSLLTLQWSINPGVSLFRSFIFSSYLFNVVLFAPNKVLLLNLILLMILYFSLIALFNHFWAATATFSSIIVIFSIADHLKMDARNEPILVSDLTMATGNTGEIMSFIPNGSTTLITLGILGVILLIVLAIVCSWYFGPGHLFHISNNPIRITTQIVVFLVIAIPFGLFAHSVGNVESSADRFTQSMGDSAKLWDTRLDANTNGVLLNLIRGFYVNVIDKPANYSQKTMKAVAHRYENAAAQINSQRPAKLTDQNVILILSESYSDPLRVPGITLRNNEDPLPYIRSLKQQTTSGLMLSSGYGGGTANLEFQALTGLSTSNFSASLKSPYQQFVPSWKYPTSFNQLWNTPGSSSVAFHAADGSLYLRHTNYKKFGFSHFWTLDGPEYVKHTDRVENNVSVSDEASYENVTDYLKAHPNKTHFIQMATIQNHMPYPGNYYSNNPFISDSSKGAPREELGNINTYSRGVKYTDDATKKFLDTLNSLKQPTTVVWYGDHLPGIYPNEIKDPRNTLIMHESDYFIWSNQASGDQGKKIADAAYSSPNYFIAQAADQMNAKVTPYLAFLTQMHEAIPAMEPQLDSHAGVDWNNALEGKPMYLDANGVQINHLNAQQKQLVNDYKLITYDITLGKNYLGASKFTTAVPEK
jgi:phosphoglycerol transferase MdoB-like AlkP superfamily enzyme